MECVMCKVEIKEVITCNDGKGKIGFCPKCEGVTIDGIVTKSEMDKYIWKWEEDQADSSQS